MFKEMPFADFLSNNAWIWWVMAASAVMFVGGILMLPVVAVRIPEDYFLDDKPALPIERRHPVIHILIWTVRNLIGFILIVAGIIMLFTPGQGILSIVVGLMLVTIPGKKALARRIVARPKVFTALNALRAKFNQPPLRLPPPGGKDKSDESKTPAGSSG